MNLEQEWEITRAARLENEGKIIDDELLLRLANYLDALYTVEHPYKPKFYANVKGFFQSNGYTVE